MAVYVDDMWRVPMGRFGRMKMSHMVADTEEELHGMAERLGLRKWFQNAASGAHYDISMSKRGEAVKFGAVEITMRELALMRRAGKLFR